MRNIYLLLLLCSYGLVNAYDKPNSIAYDSASKSYFISNTNGGTITRLDSSYNTSDVITGLTSPKDLLFATFGPYKGLLILDSNVVKVYETSGFTLVGTFPVSGAMDLEDAEIDPTQASVFYLSDTKAHKIFKVVVGGPPFYTPTITVLSTAIRNPKAMYFDSKNRLLVASDTLSSGIYSVNTSTGSATLIQTTKIDYINALVEDEQGNYYASSWGDNYFYRLDKSFKNETGLAIYSNPAGMFFNRMDDLIVLACSNCNKITFHNLHLVYLNDVDSARCPGDSFYVQINQQFKGKGTYNAGNSFYAELSDANGNFNSPIRLAQIQSQSEPASMKCSIPAGLRLNGNGFKFRIRSTDPAHISLNDLPIDVPYIPISQLGLKDTLAFCPPSFLKFGQLKDVDSAYVNYTWYLNGSKLGNISSHLEDSFKVESKIKLLKVSKKGQCYAWDSVLVVPTSKIVIPFKDVLRACEYTYLSVGGDSIADTKIEWSSKNYPGIRTEYNPSYWITSNDTFTVKMSGSAGGCSSKKEVVVFAEPRPDYSISNSEHFICSGSSLGLQPSRNQGDSSRIAYSWSPSNMLNSSSLKDVNFSSIIEGDYNLKFLATDTIYKCYDSLQILIHNISQPEVPVLASTDSTVYIVNFSKKYTYTWTLDGIDRTNINQDSILQVPNGVTKWGTYRVKVSNPLHTECSDSSADFVLNIPVGIQNQHRNSFRIYPNPSEKEIYIQSSYREGKVLVMDYTGKVCLKNNFVSNEAINIEKLKAGVYIIQLNFEAENFRTLFIKK